MADVPLASRQGTGIGNAPEARERQGAPQSSMALQSEDQWGLRPKVSLPGDIIYITIVQPWVIIDVLAGCLVEFLIDTGATFSVLTQRIGNLSNHKEYVMGLSRKKQGHTFLEHIRAVLRVGCFCICLCLCVTVPSL